MAVSGNGTVRFFIRNFTARSLAGIINQALERGLMLVGAQDEGDKLWLAYRGDLAALTAFVDWIKDGIKKG